MEQVIIKPEQELEKGLIRVEDTLDISEITDVLESIFFVPDREIRSKVISELTQYLDSKFSSDYKLKVFVAYHESSPCGFVVCQIDPYYTSYSRKCGTFGWLHAYSLESCKRLMKQCEQYVRKNKIKKLRGNINIPKNIGGIGIQYQGFDQQMLYGVAFNNEDSQISNYLAQLGYHQESEYSCVRVEQETWDKGKKIDKDIEFRYLTLKELHSMAENIRGLAKSSFFEILPDSSGQNRIYEFFNAFSQVPESFRTLPEGFTPQQYTKIPQFQEAWETCDLNKIEIWAPLAFDKTTGELVGALLGLPDLFQAWNGEPITRANVDTAMVKKGYYGKGIFSALNNLGQVTGRLFGIEYYEGTAIWSNNKRAINTIFPHCQQIRKHAVWQKRI